MSVHRAKNELDGRLERVGMTGQQLQRIFGKHRNTLLKWRKHGLPKYAHAYFDLLETLQDIQGKANATVREQFPDSD